MSLYTSSHARNVSGMHGSARCQGVAQSSGTRCRSPAIRGTEYCHGHGGLGPVVKPYANKLHERTRALRAYDQQTRARRKELKMAILEMERSGVPPEHIARLEEISRTLLKTTQLTPRDLAEVYVQPSDEQASDNQPPEEHAALAIPQVPVHPVLEESAVKPVYRSSLGAGRKVSREIACGRAQGAMLGLALGEALGATQQGKSRDTYAPICDIEGGGLFELQAGQWAAGTAMALVLTESLIQCSGLDEEDFMDRLGRWRFEGEYSCTQGYEGSCREVEVALETYRLTGNLAEVSPYHSGNSAVVRVAPVAVRYWNDPAELRYLAARQSSTTHPGSEPVDACEALAQLVGAAISSMPREDVLNLELGHVSSVMRITRGSWRKKSRDEIRSENDAVDALEAALWCVGNSATFEEAVLLAANLGGDAAAIAAMTGQLAGALYGIWAIPSHWLEQLAWRERIMIKITALFNQSER